MTTVYDAYNRRIENAWKTGVYDENGNEVHTRVVPDGARVAVPMMLMDGKPVQIDDAERERQRQQLKDERDRVRAEWDAKSFAARGVNIPAGSMFDLSRSQLPAGHRNGFVPLTDAQTAARQSSLAAYCHRIENAWRNPQGG